ncbi:hypothetical protein KI387_037283, partial [Taxus chinensis]
MSQFWKPGAQKPQTLIIDDDDGGVIPFALHPSSASGFGYMSLEKQRQRLPVFKHRNAILYLVESHATTIIVGETGSGKTTQIPQIHKRSMPAILDTIRLKACPGHLYDNCTVLLEDHDPPKYGVTNLRQLRNSSANTAKRYDRSFYCINVCKCQCEATLHQELVTVTWKLCDLPVSGLALGVACGHDVCDCGSGGAAVGCFGFAGGLVDSVIPQLAPSDKLSFLQRPLCPLNCFLLLSFSLGFLLGNSSSEDSEEDVREVFWEELEFDEGENQLLVETLVPSLPYLKESGWAEGGRLIACTQPRRLAVQVCAVLASLLTWHEGSMWHKFDAKPDMLDMFLEYAASGGVLAELIVGRWAPTVASRVAEEMGVKVGAEVGYSIRFEDVTTP